MKIQPSKFIFSAPKIPQKKSFPAMTNPITSNENALSILTGSFLAFSQADNSFISYPETEKLIDTKDKNILLALKNLEIFENKKHGKIKSKIELILTLEKLINFQEKNKD